MKRFKSRRFIAFVVHQVGFILTSERASSYLINNINVYCQLLIPFTRENLLFIAIVLNLQVTVLQRVLK